MRMRYEAGWKVWGLMLGVLWCAGGPVGGAVYYVSGGGADERDGLSAAAAWRTLERVNGQELKAGDTVLFRCGDVWRGQLLPRSGDETGYVTYGAYGTGAKPLLLGSVSRNEEADWQPEQENLWATAGGIRQDVGNIIWNEEEAVGVKKWGREELKQEGDYWYDGAAGRVWMYLRQNPAKRYRSIELALCRHIIDQGGRCYVVYDGLALRYGAAHGIGGGNVHHITVRNCDISYVGGGHQFTTAEGHPVRYGNGIEFWANAHDCLVERCRLWEIYDAALTNQNNGPEVKQYNIAYRHNIIWNSEYSFEYWNRPESSLTHHIYFDNNTCVNAGYGWGHGQRPDPSGRHLCFYSSPAPAEEVYIRNNIFWEAKGNGFYAPGWTPEAVAKLGMDHNCWYQGSGEMILLPGRGFGMDQFQEYQKAWGQEAHSICADPHLANAARGDFHLTAGSGCIDAGMDVGLGADFEGVAIPQGAAADIGAYEFPKK